MLYNWLLYQSCCLWWQYTMWACLNNRTCTKTCYMVITWFSFYHAPTQVVYFININHTLSNQTEIPVWINSFIKILVQNSLPNSTWLCRYTDVLQHWHSYDGQGVCQHPYIYCGGCVTAVNTITTFWLVEWQQFPNILDKVLKLN